MTVSEVDDERDASSGVEVVASPVRYPRSPLIGLLVIAVVPAIALLVLQRWADREAERYEASRDAVALVAGPTEAAEDDAPVEPDDALATGLIDYRRTPRIVATVGNAQRLGETIAPILNFVNDSSCGAVSVGSTTVATKNADTPVIPASNQKLLVAAAALDVLGEDHRFSTRIASPPAVDGVVSGDVYLIGGGDPVLTSDDYPIEEDSFPAFSTTSLDRLADAVVGAGITRIDGTVIGDGSRYDDEFFVEEWSEGIAGTEAGPYDALLVNDGRVRGRSSLQSDPNEGAAREFVRLLNNRGVRVNNGWGSGVASTLAPVIGEIQSEPLGSIVAEMLTNSDNNTAEMLLKEIGFVGRGEGTRAAGLSTVDASLRARGIPMDGLVLRDGSGLSANNRVTCSALLAVLQQGKGTALDAGLPVAAATGTLADEFTDSPMAGRLRAKTGSLGNPPIDEDPPAVKALSGYVDAANGDTIVFSLVLNGPEVSDETQYQALWGAFGERLDSYPSGPEPVDLGPR
jgi:D-alanyl-D-alanine carboxypeptidase/D-alanyl-D-alanine-endopeptidase (penicillin-binding protein 4)